MKTEVLDKPIVGVMGTPVAMSCAGMEVLHSLALSASAPLPANGSSHSVSRPFALVIIAHHTM